MNLIIAWVHYFVFKNIYILLAYYSHILQILFEFLWAYLNLSTRIKVSTLIMSSKFPNRSGHSKSDGTSINNYRNTNIQYTVLVHSTRLLLKLDTLILGCENTRYFCLDTVFRYVFFEYLVSILDTNKI